MKTLCLKAFIGFSLFFPAFWSAFGETYKMEYYAVFTAAYAALVLYMLFGCLQGGWKRKQIFLLGFAGVLLLYNLLSLYFNIRYLHWYGEQINNTTAFLFFLCLCWQEEGLGKDGDSLIRFFLTCAVLSNLLSILYYFLGYCSFIVCNNQFYFLKLPEDYYEFRHYWIYSHKSDYALMLALFTAAMLRFRELFKNRALWGAGIAVLLGAMLLSHSWTGFGAVGLVILGELLDRVDWKQLRFRKIYLFFGALAVAVGGAACKILLAERDLLSLGDRREIWAGAIRAIRDCPQGWGYQFGEVLFAVNDSWSTNNAHNVFLNAMLRFSVPVGLCFTLLILLAAGYCLWKGRSFLTAGLWLGLLILLNMDYSLLSYELGMFLFVIYLVCVYKREQKRE